jgi:hypothetical protein
MATVKLVLLEWVGDPSGLTLGKVYTINYSGFFKDDRGVQRNHSSGVWGPDPSLFEGDTAKAKEPESKGNSALDHQEGGEHYKLPIQPLEYIYKNGLGFCEGNVVKYITRWRNKNGLQDLLKVKHYVDLLIELEGLTKTQGAK